MGFQIRGAQTQYTVVSFGLNQPLVDIIIEEYKDVFEGIGILKEFELTLHIDKPIPTVLQQSQKISYNLRQKLLEKPIELEENDIIEKFEGPTTRVPPLVIVPKPDGNTRIIVDMSVTNQALK